jgi:hypothetical protein
LGVVLPLFAGKIKKQINKKVNLFFMETADNIDTVSNGFIWFHLKMKP